MDLKTISPQELQQRMKNDKQLCILDVRAEDKYENDHIEGSGIQSINIPKTLIFDLANDDAIAGLPKDQEIIVTCTTGNSAKKCAAILKENDYNVTVLDGGITAWREFNE